MRGFRRAGDRAGVGLGWRGPTMHYEDREGSRECDVFFRTETHSFSHRPTIL